MSEWFHVGQRVAYVGGHTNAVEKRYFFGLFRRYVPGITPFVVGAQYTVTDIGEGRDRLSGGPAVWILVSPLPLNHKPGYAYPARCFRPLRKRNTDISIFTSLLNTNKEPVEA